MPAILEAPKHDSVPNPDVEDRIREEVRIAFLEWQACQPEADAHLDQAVRKLYDFVVRGKVPEDSSRASFALSAGA